MQSRFGALIADPTTAAKLLADKLEFTDARKVADGLWWLGCYHGRAFYYADKPTENLRERLQLDRHAVFIVGDVDAGFRDYPEQCVRRGRSLADILRFGCNGEMLLDEEEIDRLAPKRTTGILCGRRGGNSVRAIRIGEWQRFVQWWYAQLREEGNARRPSWKEIQDWFHTKSCPSVRRDKSGIRTLMRDIKVLTKRDGRDAKWWSRDFTLLWNKMDDFSFVLKYGDHSLADCATAVISHTPRGYAAAHIGQLSGGHNAYQSAC
ncbi:MAG: hypothetical protein MJ249_11840 [Kiritimatiellae bacterium]|nr:hypothetical protein [Kiritimatiellia bacterium]